MQNIDLIRFSIDFFMAAAYSTCQQIKRIHN